MPITDTMQAPAAIAPPRPWPQLSQLLEGPSGQYLLQVPGHGHLPLVVAQGHCDRPLLALLINRALATGLPCLVVLQDSLLEEFAFQCGAGQVLVAPSLTVVQRQAQLMAAQPVVPSSETPTSGAPAVATPLDIAAHTAPNTFLVQVDEQLCFQYLNASALNFIGTPLQLVKGRSLNQVFPSLAGNVLLDRLQQVLATRHPLHFQHWFDNLPGLPPRFCLDLMLVPVQHGVFVYATDITALKRLERMSAGFESHLRAFAESSLSPMLAIDLAQQLSLVNQSAAQMLGNPSVAVGNSLDAVAPKLLPHFEKALAGQKFSVIYEGGQPDFPEFYETFFAPVTEESGSISGAIAIGNDVTRLHIWEQELQNWQERLQQLVDHLPDAVALMSDDYYLVSCNEKFQQLNQLTEELPALPGLHMSDYMRPSSCARALEQFEQARLHGQLEKELSITRNGRQQWFRLQIIPITINQAITGFILTVADITSHIMEMGEMERLHDQLQQRYATLQQFAFISSHTLRAPLANVLGLRQLLQDHTMEQGLPLLAALETSANQLETAINDLLNSLAQANDQQQAQPVYLSHVLRKIMRRYQPAMQKIDGRLVLHNPQDMRLPCTFETAQELMIILLSNCMKFRHPQRPPVVHISSTVQGSYNVINVSDNGLGIDLQLHGARLFGMYQRFHRDIEGKGLGLYLLKNRLDALNGFAEVDSQPDVGTTFRLFLPLAAQAQAGSPPAPPALIK